MSPDASPTLAESAPKTPALTVILCGGLAAGVLDISYAFLFFTSKNYDAFRLLRGITTALLGRENVAAGDPSVMTVLGLGLHFLIAIGAAAVFYLFSRKWRVLVSQPLISGLVFGAAVFLVMNLGVLPLSATPPKAFPPRNWISLLVAHLFCVGLPIALAAWWFSRRPASEARA